jgi:nucleotide-binding universal stress UspA family protein
MAAERRRYPYRVTIRAATPARETSDRLETRAQVRPGLDAAQESSSMVAAPRGTIVCGVKDSSDADTLVRVAFGMSERLRLRLVLVAIAEGIVDEHGEPLESVTTRGAREGAQRLLERIVRDQRLPATVECRYDVGEPAVGLARLAQEEGADVIVIGSRRARLGRGRIRAGVVDELRAASPLPVVIVPPAR